MGVAREHIVAAIPPERHRDITKIIVAGTQVAVFFIDEVFVGVAHVAGSAKRGHERMCPSSWNHGLIAEVRRARVRRAIANRNRALLQAPRPGAVQAAAPIRLAFRRR